MMLLSSVRRKANKVGFNLVPLFEETHQVPACHLEKNLWQKIGSKNSLSCKKKKNNEHGQ